jgi:hypothetical protein
MFPSLGEIDFVVRYLKVPVVKILRRSPKWNAEFFSGIQFCVWKTAYQGCVASASDFQTNAYTESVNRLAKNLNRMGRGYSFDVVKVRRLLGPEAHKATTNTIRSRPAKSAQMLQFGLESMVQSLTFDLIAERTIEYGPYILTLCRLLEAGHFE